MAFFNNRFLSTSFADPDAYLDPPLNSFMFGKCCLMHIEVPAGAHVLPIGVADLREFGLDADGAQAYKDEFEVVLPPGNVLVYMGMRNSRYLGPIHLYRLEAFQ